MRSQYLAGIAIAALATGIAAAAYSIRTSDYYCPPPSAASVTALFAPCQTFDTAMGAAITKDKAAQMGLLPPPPGPASTPAQEPAPTPVVAQDFQTMAQEHATVGVARSK
jgi:hypothetical protein